MRWASAGGEAHAVWSYSRMVYGTLQSNSIDYDTTDRSTFESRLSSFLADPGYVYVCTGAVFAGWWWSLSSIPSRRRRGHDRDGLGYMRRRYKDDIVWQSGSTSVAKMTRVRAFYIGMNEAENEVGLPNVVAKRLGRRRHRCVTIPAHAVKTPDGRPPGRCNEQPQVRRRGVGRQRRRCTARISVPVQLPLRLLVPVR